MITSKEKIVRALDSIKSNLLVCADRHPTTVGVNMRLQRTLNVKPDSTCSILCTLNNYLFKTTRVTT